MSDLPTRAQPSGRNPPWSRDEIILALELYMHCRPSFPGPNDGRIIALSAFLNQLAQTLGGSSGTKFRNPNGVAMKLQNLRRFDPAEEGRGLPGGRLGGVLRLPTNDRFEKLPNCRCTAYMGRNPIAVIQSYGRESARS
jgi:hypothetical protein